MSTYAAGFRGAPQRFAPEQEAELGTIAHPGEMMELPSATDADMQLRTVVTTFDDAIQASDSFQRTLISTRTFDSFLGSVSQGHNMTGCQRADAA